MPETEWKVSNIELRPYQLTLAEEIAQNYHQNYIIWTPVGMGKTVISYLAMIRAHNLGRLDGKKVVVIPHSRAMVGHWYDFAQDMGLLNYAKVMTSQELKFYSKLVYAKSAIERRKQEKIKKKDLMRRADIIISTPKLFSKDLEEKIFDSRLIDSVEMLFIDEASKIMTPNPHDPVWTYDTKVYYSPILEKFKYKQTIGLTATPGDTYELRILEEKLDAKTIGPSNEDIAKYAYNVETRKFYIIDPWVQKFDGKIKQIIASNVDYLAKRLRMSQRDLYFKNFLRIVAQQINNPDDRISASAKSIIKAIYTRLVLYERSFRALFDYVNKIESESEDWNFLKLLIAERAQKEPYSSKTKQFVKLIKLSKERGERVLVFDRFVDGCEELKWALKKEGISSEVVTGNMNLEEQAMKFKEFKNRYFDVLISTVGVGGAGVDLPSADVVIQYGLAASPYQMEQRKGRIRGGIEKCLVYKHTREDDKFNELQRTLQNIGEKIERLSTDPNLYDTYRKFIELLFVPR